MRWSMGWSIALLALASGSTAAPLTQAPAAEAAAPLTLAAMPLHDPFIVADRATRTYHLFTRNQRGISGDPAIGTMSYTSRDLLHWTTPKLVFRLPPAIWADAGAWAPEVHRWRGRWYLFTTLHNEAATLSATAKRRTYRRGTVVAVSDSLGGPFTLVRGGEPLPPADRMTLDGTLHVERGQPWIVYAREWIQVADGSMEAMPLTRDLYPAGAPTTLFRASEADWVAPQAQPDGGPPARVTDGPQFFRTRTGRLLMLWSSWGRDGYTEALARSRTGTLKGPWEQLPPLVAGGSGHGMVFRRFDGTPTMIVHRPFGPRARGKVYDMRDTGDTLKVVRQRTDLDGGG